MPSGGLVTANDPVNMVDPDGRVFGAVVKFARRTIKHRGNVIKAGIEVGSDIAAVVSPSSTPLERIEAAVALASPVDFDDARAAKRTVEAIGRRGGRKGGFDTRAQNLATGNTIEANGGKVTGGFNRGPETRFPPEGGGNKGSRFSDGSAQDAQGRPFQVQTVDTDAAGNISQRELDAARDIADRSGEPVICIAKTSC